MQKIKLKKSAGSMSLEASICLTIFIFLMLFLYSFFVVFEARNKLAHTLLSTADSLSYDVYETNTISGSNDLGTLMHEIYQITFEEDTPFHSSEKWYTYDGFSTSWNGNVYFSEPERDDEGKAEEDYEDDYGNKAYLSEEFARAVQDRFYAYLVGSTNDEDIENMLKKYHVSGGKNGISFDGTKIVGNDLYLKITYKLDYEFDVFGIAGKTYEQSVCSKLWK